MHKKHKKTPQQTFNISLSLFLKVRTKDHVFDSISHLIGHHRDNNLPIVSAGSELCLLQPVGRKQWRLQCLMGNRKLWTVSLTILKLEDESWGEDAKGSMCWQCFWETGLWLRYWRHWKTQDLLKIKKNNL